MTLVPLLRRARQQCSRVAPAAAWTALLVCLTWSYATPALRAYGWPPLADALQGFGFAIQAGFAYWLGGEVLKGNSATFIGSPGVRSVTLALAAALAIAGGAIALVAGIVLDASPAFGLGAFVGALAKTQLVEPLLARLAGLQHRLPRADAHR